MRYITLTNTTKLAVVSDEDFEFVSNLSNWYLDRGYVKTTKMLPERQLHRVVYSRVTALQGHVHHLDENPLNNQRENLVQLTASEHVALHNSTRTWPVGEQHGNTHLKDADILFYLELTFKLGKSQKDFAKRIGMSVAHAGDIIYGRRRPDLQPAIKEMIEKYNWVKGNKIMSDDEMLCVVRDWHNSGLSRNLFCKRDGRVSRQHLDNVIKGVRLPHLQAQIRKILD